MRQQLIRKMLLNGSAALLRRCRFLCAEQNALEQAAAYIFCIAGIFHGQTNGEGRNRMKLFQCFVSAVLSGILVGVGGTALFSTDSLFIGSFLFCFGLFFILVYRFDLYTGRVGYWLGQRLGYAVEIGITWVGNLLGTYLVARLLWLTRLTEVRFRATELVEVKLSDTPVSLFVLACFCGLLMYLAVHTCRNAKDSATRVIAMFLPVLVFAAIGFEHCVADMYFFSLSGLWTWKKFGRLLLITTGNTIGGLTFPLVRKYLLRWPENKTGT